LIVIPPRYGSETNDGTPAEKIRKNQAKTEPKMDANKAEMISSQEGMIATSVFGVQNVLHVLINYKYAIIYTR
jgi:hypothetical protein